MNTKFMQGAVSGGPRLILRLEGLALFIVATWSFQSFTSLTWWLYAAVFFVPDLSFAGYIAGPRFGAAAYNALHSTIGPIFLMAAGLFLTSSLIMGIAAIWLAHVGFDRMLGYGLKFTNSFNDTHLGRIGRAQVNA